MSKVTIKFWDKERAQYEYEEWLVLDCNGDIYDAESHFSGTLNRFYEAHFYKDGERIA